MILISHRGNINGRIEDAENRPDYIDDTIRIGYNVEVDIWEIDHRLFLGHDRPQYEIDYTWLKDRKNKLWIHCKNIKALEYFNDIIDFHYFWHEKDTVTITSQGTIWAFPGKQPIRNSIAVLPELNDEDISYCLGICSDYILKYKS